MTDDTEEKEKYIQIVLTHCSQLMCSSMSLMMKYNMIVRQKKTVFSRKITITGLSHRELVWNLLRCM